MKKRLLSLFLTFSMLLTFFPVGTVTVFASDSPMAYTDGSYRRPGVQQLQVRPDKCPDPRHCNRNWQQCFL